MYTSIFINLLEQFEILIVTFLNMDTALVLQRQMETYFEYQEQQKPMPENNTDQTEFF